MPADENAAPTAAEAVPKKRNADEELDNGAKKQKVELVAELKNGSNEEKSSNDSEKAPKKPSGIPLICGSLNWDIMGRKEKRANIKPRKVEPAWEPQIIGALSKVRITDVIAGPCAVHSFFISDDGRLFGVGRNEQGQLGLGKTKRQDGATEIPFFKSMKVIGAAGGKGHSIVMTEGNGTFGMGDNHMGQLGIGSNKGENAMVTTPKQVLIDDKVKQVACGLDFSLFLTSDGKVFSAGSSESGQLGVNDKGEYIENRKLFYSAVTKPQHIPMFIAKDPRTKEVTRKENVVTRYVSAGQHHCLAISTTDELYTWGFNGHGRLGHKTTEDELRPLQVMYFLPGGRTGTVKIAKCSYNGCFAVSNLGTTYAWGENKIAKLCCPYPLPIEDLYGWNVNDISPGRFHHVISADTSVIAMGQSTEGELGMGDERKSSSRPDKMSAVEGLKVIQCVVGVAHTVLLALDDTEEAKEIISQLETNDD